MPLIFATASSARSRTRSISHLSKTLTGVHRRKRTLRRCRELLRRGERYSNSSGRRQGYSGRRAGPVSCWSRWQLLAELGVPWMCNPAKVDPWFKPHCPSPPAIRMTPEPLTPSTALSKLPRSSALQRHRRRLRKSQKPLLQFHARPEDSRFNELRSDIQRRS
jgi:hypothetical protein